MKTPRTILITGASSGLGAALAIRYAEAGITFYLHGRDGERLAAVAKACAAKGATTHTQQVDVTDASTMEAWITKCDNDTPIDLVIANAGISAGTGGFGENAAQARGIFAVNIDGVVNSIAPLIPRMIARGTGHIALIGSLAGVRGLPSSPAYSASKAWVKAYGEGLRGWLAPKGVCVTVIAPGFIKTPLTDVNPYPMPFLMSAEKAASKIIDALAKKKGFYAFPLALYLPIKWVSQLPWWISDLFVTNLPDKPSLPQ